MRGMHPPTSLHIKPHLHGRVLAGRIDILPFFFLKSRRSLTRHKIHVRFCLRDIARHAPQKIKSQQSLTRERFYRDARIRLQLAEVTYTLRLRASDSHKIEMAEESLSQWFTYTVRDSFKELLAGFEFTKANCRKSTSIAPLVTCQLLRLKQSRFGILKRKCVKPTRA